jgi:deoxyadenosine/deoxycytidine kinase
VRKIIKEDVIHKIKSAPISKFESDNRDPYPEELSVDCNKYFNGYSISNQHNISTLTVDLAHQTDEMIFAQIKEIIKQSGMQTLYVLNRHQIIEALQQYVERNRL